MADLPAAAVKRLLNKHGNELRTASSAVDLAVAAAESYIAKLIEKGHRVAIGEQVEEPGGGKKREVLRGGALAEGKGPEHGGQEREVSEREGGGEGVASGELCPLPCRAVRDQQVEPRGQGGHPEQGQKWPHATEGRGEAEQGKRRERGEGEKRHLVGRFGGRQRFMAV